MSSKQTVNSMRLVRNLLTYLSCLLVTGCHEYIAMPDDPRYTPVIPDVPKQPEPMNGSIFVAGTGLSLYQDVKAHRVGDILTVKLTEVTKASKDAATNTKKELSTKMVNPLLFGRRPTIKIWGKLPFSNSRNKGDLEQDLENETEFKGKGDTSQNNSLTGDITVTVATVLPNKYLSIKGEKWITLNQGSEYIRLTGIVRPEDIGPNNEVLSTRIADARITYSGKGIVHNSATSGWIGKFFHSPLYPF